MSSVDDGSEDLYGNATSRLRYEAYSRLQAAAVAFGESLPIPEIVAIGGQSDGKSSLLEAFLGFRFNVREVEMGTRRPLIVQMVHDSTAEEPRCRLKDEEGEEYGPVIAPPSAVADAIRDRTAEHLAKVGGAVSSVPIVMRAEYAYCPNLTIIDTPGFILKARKGEAASTPDDILAMVKAQCAPSNRLILFLQQSSVEWASSLWMHVLTDVDPDFSRTVVVASKFDNRLKEFGERWEVDRYLAAAGYLPPSVQPFFIALPKDRGAVGCAGEWRASIQGVDAEVLRGLREGVAGGFDEERFGARGAGAEWPVLVGVGGGGGRRTAGEADAPDAADATDATGAQLRLYGSAAFARALAEFRAVVQALELPSGLSSDVVANALLGQDQHGGRAVEDVAALLAEKGARTALGPALRTLCARLGGVLAHALGVAQALVFEDLGECARFRAAIAAACDALVARLVDRARALLEHGLEVAVAGGGRDAWAPGHLDLLGEGVGEEEGDDEVDENASPMHALLEEAKGRGPKAARVAVRFRRVCAAVASGSLPTSLQTCLLSTLREGVLPHLLQEVCGTPDAECMALFQDPAEVAALRERREAAERRAEGLVRCRDEFSELVACL
ncbi:Dynamin-like protein C [Auxenochlorella protothecoides]|uniref:Dynamin-like protein C n=1 Tax=Auxenochlorella protothecoides TaxID=3075 RepID=A0A087SFA5_AUXPR|nr:Dynamin-like protein C [Auxenochlorella protothecoides]KFM24409.1 Dynamin-like protein C [Auxenochlorella protothecoides]